MKINGETICCEVEGQGPPVVLIHGWTLNLRMWDRQMKALSRRFRVIRYDRRGFGKSSGREDLQWDGADLEELLDHLDIDNAHILGMSQGGSVALRFVRTFPARARSLILHGSIPPEGYPLPWTGPDRIPMSEWRSLVKKSGLDAFRRDWSTHPIMRVPDDRHDVQVALADMIQAYRGERFLNPAKPSGPIGPATMDDLPRLTLPTLVVIGETDVPYLQIAARMFAYYLPNAQMAVIPGGGHMINLLEPERYNTTILRFLENTQITGGEAGTFK
ncbi:MAG TPA: alpha/beta hydrolase [bacterium]|nr:alpha/beta hydrolase [bacterium]